MRTDWQLLTIWPVWTTLPSLWGYHSCTSSTGLTQVPYEFVKLWQGGQLLEQINKKPVLPQLKDTSRATCQKYSEENVTSDRALLRETLQWIWKQKQTCTEMNRNKGFGQNRIFVSFSSNIWESDGRHNPWLSAFIFQSWLLSVYRGAL